MDLPEFRASSIVDSMEMVAGWLFFNLENTKTIFISDKLDVEARFNIDWQALLDERCLENFVRHFNAQPTKDSPLRGYRIDAAAADVDAWIKACYSRDAEASK